MIERMPGWVRWLLIVPASLSAGYLVATALAVIVGPGGGGLIAAWGHLIATLSGAAYVVTGVLVAYRLAPRHKRLIPFILGAFILGDLSFIHLVAPDLFTNTSLSQGASNPLSPILSVLRVEDYRHLRYGGLARVLGAALAAICLVGATRPSGEKSS